MSRPVWKKLDEVIYVCKHDAHGNLKSPYDRRRELLREVIRFEKSVGWRGDNPQLAALYAGVLRALAEAIQKKPKGRAKGSGSLANQLLQAAVPMFAEALKSAQDKYEKNTGQQSKDFASDLHKPGQSPHDVPQHERAKPTGLNTLIAVLEVHVEMCGQADFISKDDIKKAVENHRRSDRRRRNSSKKAK